MAEAIVDGIGSGNYAHVDDTNRLFVRTEGISVGSISVSAGSETYIKGGSIEVYNVVQTAGSIYSMPAVSVAAGSEAFNYGQSGTSWIELATTNEGWLLTRSFTPIIDSGSTGLIIANSETEVIKHVISTGSVYYLTGFDATGTSDASFYLYYNDTLQTKLKINPAERNIQKTYPLPLAYNAGSMVLTAKHQDSDSQNFDGTIYGVELDE